MVNQVYEKTNQKMQKAMEALRHELSKMRTGRASLSVLDDVRVEYYGTPTPLKQLASLSTPDARTIVIQPWDNSAAAAIEKAIQKSDLGLNPVNDGKVIRIPIPPLNEERRKELIKKVSKMTEETRVALRNLRRDEIENVKKKTKAKEMSEDDGRRAQEEIQKILDKYIADVDASANAKEKELMEV